MNQKLIDWTEEVRKQHKFKAGKVLEVGSLNVNGTVKHLFQDNEEYVGIDFRPGPDVDIVINSHNLMDIYKPNTVDTMICMNMLEHDNRPWETLSIMNFILKKGGMFFVAWPGINFPVHDYPGDYWRVTEQAMKEIVFKGYELLDMKTIYTKKNAIGQDINGIVCAVGKKL